MDDTGAAGSSSSSSSSSSSALSRVGQPISSTACKQAMEYKLRMSSFSRHSYKKHAARWTTRALRAAAEAAAAAAAAGLVSQSAYKQTKEEHPSQVE
jgi:hypothetical protein